MMWLRLIFQEQGMYVKTWLPETLVVGLCIALFPIVLVWVWCWNDIVPEE